MKKSASLLFLGLTLLALGCGGGDEGEMEGMDEMEGGEAGMMDSEMEGGGMQDEMDEMEGGMPEEMMDTAGMARDTTEMPEAF